MFRVGEVAGRRVVHHGVGAVAFSCVAVAVGAVFVVYGFRGVEIGVGGGNRILAQFVFERDFPGRFVEGGETDRKEDQEDHKSEEKFDECFRFFGRSGHGFVHREKFRIGGV